MARGWTLSDVPERLTWADLRDFVNHLPPDGTSAYFRARHPESWWWRPEFDFFSEILLAAQVANWQRADPARRGAVPKPAKRPKVKRANTDPSSVNDLEQRKAKLRR